MQNTLIPYGKGEQERVKGSPNSAISEYSVLISSRVSGKEKEDEDGARSRLQLGLTSQGSLAGTHVRSVSETSMCGAEEAAEAEEDGSKTGRVCARTHRKCLMNAMVEEK